MFGTRDKLPGGNHAVIYIPSFGMWLSRDYCSNGDLNGRENGQHQSGSNVLAVSCPGRSSKSSQGHLSACPTWGGVTADSNPADLSTFPQMERASD